MLTLETKELGTLEIEEEQVFTFAEGIPGFEQMKRYAWIGLGEDLPIWYMQSIDDPDLRFVVTNPFAFVPNYEFKLDEAVKEKLDIEAPEQVQVYCLVSIPGEQLQQATVNLVGPLIVNVKNRQAQQIILHDTPYAMKHPLFSASETEKHDERNEG